MELSIITDMPLTLGTDSQRTREKHITAELPRLNFISLVSVAALGFAALSHERAFLTLKLFYPYFKIRLAYHTCPTVCIILIFPFFKL